MPLLQVDNVSFAYAGRAILHDVSLALAPGQVTVLLGPNASGKSTLLRLVMGRLSPAGGSIQWQSRAIAHYKPRELARLVAYLPQAPLADDEQTVIEVLKLGRAAYWGAFGIESASDATVVNTVADQLNLADLLHRPLHALSGGQRQRVFLARCLVQQPAALVLDEPSTYLDLRHQVELCRRLRQLARENNLAILMALHDLNLAATYADELVLLHEGRLVARGNAQAVLQPQLLRQVYGVDVDVVHPSPGRSAIVLRED